MACKDHVNNIDGHNDYIYISTTLMIFIMTCISLIALKLLIILIADLVRILSVLILIVAYIR